MILNTRKWELSKAGKKRREAKKERLLVSKLVKSEKENNLQATLHIRAMEKYIAPKSKDFYSSDEWETLKKWARLRFKRVCFCCGLSKTLHLDHISPKSTHPELCLDFLNVQYLCSLCNYTKSNKSKAMFVPRYRAGKRRDRFFPSNSEYLNIKKAWVKFYQERQSASLEFKPVETLSQCGDEWTRELALFFL